MMNYVWGVLFLGCLGFGILSGKGGLLAGAAMEGALEGIRVCLTMLGGYALWMGMMNWVKLSGASDGLTRALRPVMRFLFPGVPKESAAERAITMNLAANMLGIGNAATPLGIEAMRELRKLEDAKKTAYADNAHATTAKDVYATDAMCMFLIINASSIQLIPGTVVLLRAAAGSANPSAVVLPGLIATTCSTLAGVIAGKIAARGGTQGRSGQQNSGGKQRRGDGRF